MSPYLVRASRADIDALPVFPLIDPAFLTMEEHAALLGFAERNDAAFGALDAGDYWQGRTLSPINVDDNYVRDMFRHIQDRTIAKLSTVLSEQLGPQPPLYCDLINYARWPAGYELQPHADSENPNGAPHPYPWRDFATVIYLNDDYDGGEIYFPNFGLELRPQPRMLAMFPGTLRFLHGVRRVTRGIRHTIASFITFDPLHRRDHFTGTMS